MVLELRLGDFTEAVQTNLMIGLKRISRDLMNMVGWTIYRALMFFLYLKSQEKQTKSICTHEKENF